MRRRSEKSNPSVTKEPTHFGPLLLSNKICALQKCPSSITLTSWWARCRLKSPACRMFAQPFVQAQIKTSKLRVTGLCQGNSPVTGGFPSQKASNSGSVSIWWRHVSYSYMYARRTCAHIESKILKHLIIWLQRLEYPGKNWSMLWLRMH